MIFLKQQWWGKWFRCVGTVCILKEPLFVVIGSERGGKTNEGNYTAMNLLLTAAAAAGNGEKAGQFGARGSGGFFVVFRAKTRDFRRNAAVLFGGGQRGRRWGDREKRGNRDGAPRSKGFLLARLAETIGLRNPKIWRPLDIFNERKLPKIHPSLCYTFRREISNKCFWRHSNALCSGN